jgi:hypothetical protein
MKGVRAEDCYRLSSGLEMVRNATYIQLSTELLRLSVNDKM